MSSLQRMFPPGIEPGSPALASGFFTAMQIFWITLMLVVMVLYLFVKGPHQKNPEFYWVKVHPNRVDIWKLKKDKHYLRLRLYICFGVVIFSGRNRLKLSKLKLHKVTQSVNWTHCCSALRWRTPQRQVWYHQLLSMGLVWSRHSPYTCNAYMNECLEAPVWPALLHNLAS